MYYNIFNPLKWNNHRADQKVLKAVFYLPWGLGVLILGLYIWSPISCHFRYFKRRFQRPALLCGELHRDARRIFMHSGLPLRRLGNEKTKNTCASVNTTKVDTHARLYELGGNEQSKLSCQASHTFCKPWRGRMADVWAINRMPTVQTGMAERFWKTPNLYANEGVVRCNTPCSFSAERCEAGWFEFAVGRVCDLASLGHPHSCLLKGTSFVFSGWSPDMKMTGSDTSWPNCKAT